MHTIYVFCVLYIDQKQKCYPSPSFLFYLEQNNRIFIYICGAYCYTMHTHYSARFLLFIGIICCLPSTLHAYSLRQFSNKDGLSNSAILSLYQDQQGIIWIGSCDGLNVFDGVNIQILSLIHI